MDFSNEAVVDSFSFVVSPFPIAVPVKTKAMAKKSSGKKIVGCLRMSVDHFFADRFFCRICFKRSGDITLELKASCDELRFGADEFSAGREEKRA
jgi:hypothetical protein